MEYTKTSMAGNLPYMEQYRNTQLPVWLPFKSVGRQVTGLLVCWLVKFAAVVMHLSRHLLYKAWRAFLAIGKLQRDLSGLRP